MAQNCYKLNEAFYASLGEKKAFVMSQGRNMLILKIVGYAEEVAYYYQLLDFKAHVWIAHQRYPTRGRVWHPGGAHPFAALNTALVHNGDFANYYSVSEYLSQRHFFPQFLTDTEVAVLIFDLWHRLYGYSLEYVIESMAPTTERDFDLLPPERQHVYRQLQAANIHGSPDGPWFFIIARNDPERRSFDLIGITDTSMLRPQVFALQDGEVQIGLICSEKQAIDATLASLAQEDPRICPVADLYWNARGGSATDGGAFIFSLEPHNGSRVLSCHDKFGKPRTVPWHQRPWDGMVLDLGYQEDSRAAQLAAANLEDQSGRRLYEAISRSCRHQLLRRLPGNPGGGGEAGRAGRPCQGRGHQRPDPAVGPALRPGGQEAQQSASSSHGSPDPHLPGYSPAWGRNIPAATAGSIGTTGSFCRRPRRADAVLVLNAARLSPGRGRLRRPPPVPGL